MSKKTEACPAVVSALNSVVLCECFGKIQHEDFKGWPHNFCPIVLIGGVYKLPKLAKFGPEVCPQGKTTMMETLT